MIALYLHFPFCLRKCRYCAFNSSPLPAGEEGKSLAAGYVAALEREIALYAPLCRGEALGSIYLGGGTPTLLPAELLSRVLAACRRHFLWAEDIEITVEANPGTLSPEKLNALKEAGANRLSIGAQSFHQDELELLGRAHQVAETEAAYDAARAAGFENINLDLIYALPGQTLSRWQENLRRALLLSPEHLSVYGLSLEEGTPLALDAAAGKIVPCGEKEQVAMWKETAAATAAAGYGRYEISNYARPGRECRHNICYWENRPYLGLGAGAHGFWKRVRYANEADVCRYVELLEQGRFPRALEEHQTPEQERTDTVIMGLRLTRGLSRRKFAERFGCSFEELYGDELAALIDEGLMEMSEEAVYLTERGRLLANYVLAYFV